MDLPQAIRPYVLPAGNVLPPVPADGYDSGAWTSKDLLDGQFIKDAEAALHRLAEILLVGSGFYAAVLGPRGRGPGVTPSAASGPRSSSGSASARHFFTAR